MPTFSVIVMDVDISAYVTDLGTIEEVQSALFLNSQLFAGEQIVTLDNTKNIFTPGAIGALFNTPWYNAPCLIYRNSTLVFSGLVQGLDVSMESSTAKLKVMNALAPLADRIVDFKGSGLNPGSAALAMLVQGGMEYFVDKGSFLGAGLPAEKSGATISMNIPASAKLTVLQALQQISDTCSLEILTIGSVIYCKAFKAYGGNDEGLRAEVNIDNSRKIGQDNYDRRSLSNRVEIVWGANKFLAIDRQSEQASSGQAGSPAAVVTTISASAGSTLSFDDIDSAGYFGNLMLDRLDIIPRQISMILDPAFGMISMGDRHPVTIADKGLNRAPFQALMVRRTFTSDDSEVTFKSLSRRQL